MNRIAPLSVLTRGTDTAYRLARASAKALQSTEAAERTAAAEDRGNVREQLEALRDELVVAKSDLADVYDEWEGAEALSQVRADQIAVLQAKVEDLEAQNQQLRVAFSYQEDSTEDEGETFDNAPELRTAHTESLEALCSHLERVAEGRIVFTPNAITAWRKCDRYTTPDLMRDCLVKLARVAHDIHDGQERVLGHFGTWVRETYDLRIAMQDDAMPKRFESFEFEDTSYKRVPHVKVNDGVPPHECGRIYFAIDSDNDRIIVDHVGLHW